MLSTMATRVAHAYLKQAWDVLPGMREVSRTTYLPKDIRGTPPNVDPEGTDLAIWTWESAGKLMGVAFQGKAGKPLFFHHFRNEGERDRVIATAIRDRKSQMKRKEDKQEARRNFKHAIEPGDIYYTSWGYDQTNVDFYEVIAVADRSITVRPIGVETVSSERGADYVAPAKGKYTGPAERKVPREHGFSVDNHLATKWSGSPVYQTALGYGH